MLGHAQASTSERYIHLAAGAGQGRADLIAGRALGLSTKLSTNLTGSEHSEQT